VLQGVVDGPGHDLGVGERCDIDVDAVFVGRPAAGGRDLGAGAVGPVRGETPVDRATTPSIPAAGVSNAASDGRSAASPTPPSAPIASTYSSSTPRRVGRKRTSSSTRSRISATAASIRRFGRVRPCRRTGGVAVRGLVSALVRGTSDCNVGDAGAR
jgi:hypothetical protein